MVMTMAGRSKRGQEGARTSAPIVNIASLSAGVARLRLHDWGALETRRKQRLGLFLRQLRERSDETMDEVCAAAEADGVTSLTKRTLWSLEQLTDPAVAENRERINYMVVNYLLERYGATAQEAWDFATAEDDLASRGERPTNKRAEARALGDLYLHLTEHDPSHARTLLEFARFILGESEQAQ